MQVPKISNTLRFNRLQPPTTKVRVVIDTDTYNEIDDQFAIVYAMLSPEQMQVEALYAAPFFNDLVTSPGEGTEKSYEEILRLLDRLGASPENFAYRGSNDFLADYDHPHESEAVTDLIERAMGSDEPLYVVAIGALTNIASAILIEPKIIEKIIVVWLGGNALYWPHNLEFNLMGDVLASRLVLDCGVPLTLIPCQGVTTHLVTTVPEIELYVEGKGAIGDFLAKTFKEHKDDHFGWSKEIWDIVAVAYLIDASWIPSHVIPCPIISQRMAVSVPKHNSDRWYDNELTWSFDESRHLIRCAYHLERDPIFRDMFTKLDRWSKGEIKLDR